MCGSDIFLGILAIIFPPLAVWIKRGICSADSLINIALCCLAYIPGLIHAWYIIAQYPDPTYEELAQAESDAERGGRHHRVTYYYIQQGTTPANPAQHGGYGTVGPAQSASGQYQSQEAMAQGMPGSSSGGEAPPTYQDTIKGDNKVQTH